MAKFKVGNKVKIKWHYIKGENCDCAICKQGYGWVLKIAYTNAFYFTIGLKKNPDLRSFNLLFIEEELELFCNQKQLNLFSKEEVM